MTEPSTARSVRALRHSIRKRAAVVFKLTHGVPGATKDQQIMVLDQQIKMLEEALEKAKEARDIVFLRDFDAHQQTKAAANAAVAAVEAVPESPEKAAEAQTFAEIIAQLSGETETPAEKPKDDIPPF